VNEGFETAHLRAEALSGSHSAELAVLHADERVMRTMGGTATSEESGEWMERNMRRADESGLGVFRFAYEREVEHRGRPRLVYRRSP
jgi:hypothetical protein